jgi:hypothetical protein
MSFDVAAVAAEFIVETGVSFHQVKYKRGSVNMGFVVLDLTLDSLLGREIIRLLGTSLGAFRKFFC